MCQSLNNILQAIFLYQNTLPGEFLGLCLRILQEDSPLFANKLSISRNTTATSVMNVSILTPFYENDQVRMESNQFLILQKYHESKNHIGQREEKR